MGSGHYHLIPPMIAMVAIIFGVLICLFLSRVQAIKAKSVRFRYFKLMQTTEALPELMQRTSRNFSNQFEMPLLFFAACLLLTLTQSSDETNILLAWTFVASRLLHSAIHITYNHVIHRAIAFAFGVLVLGVLWIRIAIDFL